MPTSLGSQGGRAFFLPLRMIGQAFKSLAAMIGWLVRAVAELRHTEHRINVDAARARRLRNGCAQDRSDARADCTRVHPASSTIRSASTSARISRGSRPVKWGDDDLAEDLSFVGADPTFRASIDRERDRARSDMRRLARVMKSGLIDEVARHLDVDASLFGPEHIRAASIAYRADYAGIRPALSCKALLSELQAEVLDAPLGRRPWWPRPSLKRAFDRWWAEHGTKDDAHRDAMWRAIVEDRERIRAALRCWADHGDEGARAKGVASLAEILRHPARVTEQLVTLRTVQTLSLIDMLNYRQPHLEPG